MGEGKSGGTLRTFRFIIILVKDTSEVDHPFLFRSLRIVRTSRHPAPGARHTSAFLVSYHANERGDHWTDHRVWEVRASNGIHRNSIQLINYLRCSVWNIDVVIAVSDAARSVIGTFLFLLAPQEQQTRERGYL